MRPDPVGPPGSTAPASAALVRSLLVVRRRARAVLLLSAVVAALAADVWYDIVGNGIAALLHLDIYFPLFFLVVFSVFAAGALLRTRLETFSRELDARFKLKERLGAAAAYRASKTIPAAIVEAQARESLDAVDFARLRLSFRFRPYGALAALALGAAVTGWLWWRFPWQFEPKNLAFRQGATLVRYSRDLRADRTPSAGGERNTSGGMPGQTADRRPPPGVKPPPLPGATGKGSEGATQSGSDKTPEKTGEPAKTAGSSPGKDSRSAPQPSPGKGSGNGPAQGNGQASSASRDTSWRREQSRAFEETRQISPATAKPAGGSDAAFSDLGLQSRGGALPPLPFFRLLTGKPAADALLDPETITVILDAYPGKYRAQLEAYLKALQARREEKRGS